MNNFLKSLSRLYRPIRPIPPGIYPYITPQDDSSHYRLHLRIEPDGSGILIVNAATVLHLNKTAVAYAYYLIHKQSPEQVGRLMSGLYRVRPQQASQDFQDFAARIRTLAEAQDLGPVTSLGAALSLPDSGKITAPYRLDCALTYRLPAGADAEAAPTRRVERELTTDEWQAVLDKAWQIGIPHVVFTGGEPTLRADLAQLIAHAESLGQVSGLLTDGLYLAENAALQHLLQTGLDHLMIVLQPDNPAAWKALENVNAADIFYVVHLTLTAQNAAGLPDLLQKLAAQQVKALSLSASTSELAKGLPAFNKQAAALQMELISDLPVPYSSVNPFTLEAPEAALPAGAGRAWLYVEPDGDVLPAQGVNRPLGNILKDPWAKIWGNPPAAT
jgi:hypothetical protein